MDCFKSAGAVVVRLSARLIAIAWTNQALTQEQLMRCTLCNSSSLPPVTAVVASGSAVTGALLAAAGLLGKLAGLVGIV